MAGLETGGWRRKRLELGEDGVTVEWEEIGWYGDSNCGGGVSERVRTRRSLEPGLGWCACGS